MPQIYNNAVNGQPGVNQNRILSGTTYDAVNTSNYRHPTSLPTLTSKKTSEPFYGDLGYNIDIPWPDVSTVGYLNGGTMKESGGLITNFYPSNRLPTQDNLLILKDDPEYYAVNDRVRSVGGIPAINLNEPAFQFARAKHTLIVQ